MRQSKLIAPVVKWVGGKRQLMNQIDALLPKKISTYYEPFIGGGAVLFYLKPQKAVVSDLNGELINLYTVIKNNTDELIEDLKRHKNESQYFYEIREQDRDKSIFDKLTNVERASRLIYLNKTCFNGLFRVNSSGEFNTPFGNYKNPNIVNEPTLRAVSNYFNKADVAFCCQDYAITLQEAKKGSFAYLDPPYDPVSDTSSFTGYNKGGFNRNEQIRLKEACDKLDSKGVKFLLSNSSTKFIKDLYKGYDIITVQAKRSINSVAEKRGEIEEVLVRNYE